MNKFYASLGFDPKIHSVKTEVLAGLTSFLAITYILVVNPIILSATGMDRGALFTATVLAAVGSTMMMAFYAKLPFVLASGMGLNAFFAYTLVLGMGYTWEQALTAVFLEGLCFILLTVFKVRQAIVNAIPACMRNSFSAGIGLFIAYLGLQNGNLLISSDATLTTIAPWTTTSVIAFVGILVAAILMSRSIKGALFYSIIIMTIIGIPFGVTDIPEDFSLVSMPHSLSSIAFHLDFSRFLSFDIEYYILLATLLFMDMFDTIGTLIGTANAAGMVDEKTGKMPRLSEALMADAVGTTFGALVGTSTVTTYAESSTGVMQGGRTGMTALTTAVLFVVSLFFSPLFLIIPSAATTCALIIVGTIMIAQISKLNFNDMSESVPSFIMIITMPLMASISEGIGLGLMSYVVIKLLSGKHKDVSWVMYVLAAFFVLKYFSPLFY